MKKVEKKAINFAEIETQDLDIYASRLSSYINELKKLGKDTVGIKNLNVPNTNFNFEEYTGIIDKEIDTVSEVMEQLSEEINKRLSRDTKLTMNYQVITKKADELYKVYEKYNSMITAANQSQRTPVPTKLNA